MATINTTYHKKQNKYMSTNKLQITPKQLSVGLTIGVLIWGVTSISTYTEPVAKINDKPQLEILEAKATEIVEVIPEKQTALEIAQEELEIINKQIELEKKKQGLNVEQKAHVITAEEVETKVSISNQAIVPKPDINSILNEHEVRIYSQCKALELTTEQTAFVLANTRHETAQYRFLKEIDGRGQARRLGYQGGENWYGRGYIQLTHLNNYKNWSKWTGKDLVANPDILTTDLDLSAFVACSGIKHGSFTAKGKLSDYVNESKKDYYNARSLVNGDKHKIGNKIVGYTHEYITKLNQI